MEIGAVGIQAPQWYDRVLSSQVKYTTGAFPPHVITQRWVYTVPLNKRAFIGSIFLFATRVAAAAPAGITEDNVSFQPAGGVEYYILRLRFNDNAIEVARDQFQQPGMMLLPGDAIRYYTSDASTGGIIDHSCSMTIFEFSP